MAYSKRDYQFVRFEKSHIREKKYNAILKNKKTGRLTRVPFGSSSYDQYRDSTGLGLYSHKDHNDKKRRANHRSRHRNDNLNDYSPGFWSWRFLWS